MEDPKVYEEKMNKILDSTNIKEKEKTYLNVMKDPTKIIKR